MKIVKIEPEYTSLYTLCGQIAAKKQFIEQAWPHSEEYWNCQRDLAEMERKFAEENDLWVASQKTAKKNETGRKNKSGTG